MGLVATEAETPWQRSSQSAKASERFRSAAVSGHLELAVAGDTDFNVVAVLQVEGVNDG